ncbi:MAG: DUF1700 domain-containing protein [Erysipelotrichaceae bacterium]
MTTQQFKDALHLRLAILNEKERNDTINEYVDHIEMKLQAGKSETEAIADFGDIDELCNQILESYHVDVNYTKKANRSLEDVFNAAIAGITNFADLVVKRELSDIVRLLVTLFLMALAMLLIFGGINMILSLLLETLRFLPYQIYGTIYNIIQFVVSIAYFGIACFVVVGFLKTKVTQWEAERSQQVVTKQQEKRETEIVEAVMDQNLTTPVTAETNVTAETSETDETMREETTAPIQPSVVYRKAPRSFSSELGYLVGLFAKFIGWLIVLPFWVATIGSIVALGILVGLLAAGVMLVGPVVILLGVSVCGLAISLGLSAFLLRPLRQGGN